MYANNKGQGQFCFLCIFNFPEAFFLVWNLFLNYNLEYIWSLFPFSLKKGSVIFVPWLYKEQMFSITYLENREKSLEK